MTTQSNINLNTCVPGQKVKLRNDRVVKYESFIQDQSTNTYMHTVGGNLYMNDGFYWEDKRESSLNIVEIFPIEEEPTKSAPELTHLITDQIDVTNPDHVSIIPHSGGVTISIKKGLTTISWRHYNH